MPIVIKTLAYRIPVLDSTLKEAEFLFSFLCIYLEADNNYIHVLSNAVTLFLFPKLPPLSFSHLPIFSIAIAVTIAVAVTVTVTIVAIITSLGLNIVHDQLDRFNLLRSHKVVWYADLLFIGITLTNKIQTTISIAR